MIELIIDVALLALKRDIQSITITKVQKEITALP